MNILFDAEEQQGNRFSMIGKTKDCPSCDGTGIGHELTHDDETVSMAMYDEIDCVVCNGKGYIIEEEENE